MFVQPWSFLFLVFVDVVKSYPEIELPDCLSVTGYGESICNDNTYNWCKWNGDYNICENTDKVKIDAIFIDWYDIGVNCFWAIFIPVLYSIIFVISKQVGFILLHKQYISTSYLEKCIIYIFEILGIIPVLINIFYPKFVYDPIFNPSKYKHVTPQDYSQLYGSLAFITVSLCVMYMIEMIYARRMRWQLKMHHWIGISSS